MFLTLEWVSHRSSFHDTTFLSSHVFKSRIHFLKTEQDFKYTIQNLNLNFVILYKQYKHIDLRSFYLLIIVLNLKNFEWFAQCVIRGQSLNSGNLWQLANESSLFKKRGNSSNRILKLLQKTCLAITVKKTKKFNEAKNLPQCIEVEMSVKKEKFEIRKREIETSVWKVHRLWRILSVQSAINL